MWLNISIFVKILGSSIAQVEVLIFGEGQWPMIPNLWSGYRSTMRGCMQNFSLLSQFFELNAACTNFGVTKRRIAPPLQIFSRNYFQFKHFCENFRFIGALHQVEVVFGFHAKSWFLVKVNDLWSQIFFVIRVSSHNGRL